MAALVSTAHFFSHFYMLSLPPLFPFLKGQFEVSYTALGAVMTVYSLTTAVGQIPVGFLVDRHGGRRFLIPALAIKAIAIGLIGVFASYPAMVALVLLAGVANTVFHPADFAIMSASVSERRMGRAFSFHLFGGNLGFAAAPPVILGLTAMVGWRTALVIAAAAGIAATVWMISGASLMCAPPPRSAAPKSDAAAGPAIPGLAVLLSAPIVLMFLFNASIASVTAGMQTFSVTALNLIHGTPLAVGGMALTGFLAGHVVGALSGGYVADHTRRHRLVVVAAIVAGSAPFLLLSMTDLAPATLIATTTISGILLGAVRPSRDMIVRSHTPEGEIGKVFGFTTAGMPVGAAITPLFFGWLVDQGLAQLTFTAMTASLGLAILVVVAVRCAPLRRPDLAPVE